MKTSLFRSISIIPACAFGLVWLIGIFSTSAQCPSNFPVTMAGDGCAGKPNSITILSTQIGISYQLKRDGQNYGAAILSNGFPVTWQNILQSGLYTIHASKNGCPTVQMMNTKWIGEIPTVTISGPSILSDGGITLSWNEDEPNSNLAWYKDGQGLLTDSEEYGSINVTEPGIYILYVANEDGCENSSAPHYVGLHESPNYNGIISSIQWRTNKPINVTGNEYTGMYTFKYDKKYQLLEALWAEPNFVTNQFSPAGNKFRLGTITYDLNGNILKLKRHKEDGQILHNFHEYQYNTTAHVPFNNRLDAIAGRSTYSYNAIGQLVTENTEANVENPEAEPATQKYMEYDVSGKVTKVYSSLSPHPASLLVEYLYDDRGFRLAKINYQTDKTTWYIRDGSGNVISSYDQSGTVERDANNQPVVNTAPLTQVEVPIYGQDRIGQFYPGQGGSTDYEMTDHLGNVRALLRDDVLEYKATMEDNGEADYTNPRVTEMAFFVNIEETEDQNIYMNHTPPGAVAEPNRSAYLNWIEGGIGTPVGPAIGLRVEPGDKLELETWAKFEQKQTYSRSLALAALSPLLGGTMQMGGFEGLTPGEISDFMFNGLTTAGYPDDGSQTDRPFAYLNYIIFNDDLEMVDANWVRIGEEAGFPSNEMGMLTPHQHLKFEEPIKITEAGYVYVWVSNESEDTKVWFDDLIVRLHNHIVVQATDYGAWGDVIREQRTDMQSRYRYAYQGQYSEKDEETGWNHFELREFDPVIGRWTTTDPKRVGFSPYWSMNNNPVSLIDPDGGAPPTEYVNVTTGQRVSVKDGYDLVVTVEGANWDKFLAASGKTTDFATLSSYGSEIYMAHNYIDFFEQHRNPAHHEWQTMSLKFGRWVFPNPDETAHKIGTAGNVDILRGQSPYEVAIVHTHDWPGHVGGPSEYPDRELHKTDFHNVYHIVVDEKYLHFYNRMRVEKSPLSGKALWRKSEADFKIERSVFNR